MTELAIGGVVLLLVAIGCGVLLVRHPDYKHFAGPGLVGALAGLVMVVLALVGKEEVAQVKQVVAKKKAIKEQRKEAAEDKVVTEEAIQKEQEEERVVHEVAVAEQKEIAKPKSKKKRKRTRLKG